jgi:hypothetical protein
MFQYGLWRQFITDFSPNYTVLLVLKNNAIKDIIENPFCGNNNIKSISCIPYVEVWKKDPITVSNIHRVVFVPPLEPQKYISCSMETAQKYLETIV